MSYVKTNVSGATYPLPIVRRERDTLGATRADAMIQAREIMNEVWPGDNDGMTGLGDVGSLGALSGFFGTLKKGLVSVGKSAAKATGSFLKQHGAKVAVAAGAAVGLPMVGAGVAALIKSRAKKDLEAGVPPEQVRERMARAAAKAKEKIAAKGADAAIKAKAKVTGKSPEQIAAEAAAKKSAVLARRRAMDRLAEAKKARKTFEKYANWRESSKARPPTASPQEDLSAWTTWIDAVPSYGGDEQVQWWERFRRRLLMYKRAGNRPVRGRLALIHTWLTNPASITRGPGAGTTKPTEEMPSPSSWSWYEYARLVPLYSKASATKLERLKRLDEWYRATVPGAGPSIVTSPETTTAAGFHRAETPMQKKLVAAMEAKRAAARQKYADVAPEGAVALQPIEPLPIVQTAAKEASPLTKIAPWLILPLVL